jgi:glucan endo-1,3-alpha-glucosidase
MSDAASFRSFISRYANSPAQLYLNDRPLVSTFSGESCTFGQDSVNDGWLSVIRDPSVPPVSRTVVPTAYCELTQCQVHFIPAFFVANISTLPQYTATDGNFNWDGGWPKAPGPVNFSLDAQHIAANGGKFFMASASPWFFTVRKFASVRACRARVDASHSTTRRRTGGTAATTGCTTPAGSNSSRTGLRSTSSRSSRGTTLASHTTSRRSKARSRTRRRGSTAMTTPVSCLRAWHKPALTRPPRAAFLDMGMYYIQAFKTGRYPAITKDAVYITSRPHAHDAIAANDGLGRPLGWDWVRRSLSLLNSPC